MCAPRSCSFATFCPLNVCILLKFYYVEYTVCIILIIYNNVIICSLYALKPQLTSLDDFFLNFVIEENYDELSGVPAADVCLYVCMYTCVCVCC